MKQLQFNVSKEIEEKMSELSIVNLKKVMEFKILQESEEYENQVTITTLESKKMDDETLKVTIGVFNNLDTDINDLRIVVDLSAGVAENSKAYVFSMEKEKYGTIEKNSVLFEVLTFNNIEKQIQGMEIKNFVYQIYYKEDVESLPLYYTG